MMNDKPQEIPGLAEILNRKPKEDECRKCGTKLTDSEKEQGDFCDSCWED